MINKPDSDDEHNKSTEQHRCPNCDTIIDNSTSQCIMCGFALPTTDSSPLDTVAEKKIDPQPATPPPIASPTITPTKSKIKNPITLQLPKLARKNINYQSVGLTIMVSLISLFVLYIGWAIIRNPADLNSLSFIPTITPIPPTSSPTPTWTPIPSQTPQATNIPTITPVPAPTETPRPFRLHTIATGDTCIGVAFRYSIDCQSIADLNDLNPGAFFVGQKLDIPWPTATPPLEPILLILDNLTFVVDPTECPLHEIKKGDSLAGLGAIYNVDFRAILAVNRLNDKSVLRVGDKICIPAIIVDETGELPPTPGPSPTPPPAGPIKGPQLLSPTNNQTLSNKKTVTLQWVAIKDLAVNEWYLVELTALNEPNGRPQRHFVRATSFQFPLPTTPTTYSWQVTLIQVTDLRTDAQFIYERIGIPSQLRQFSSNP